MPKNTYRELILYSKPDVDLIKSNIAHINAKINTARLTTFNPKYTDRQKIFSLILEYILENERKIYGGYALNKLLIDKSKQHKQHNKHNNYYIYEDDELPDIDFYSYDPNTDIINLCNKIYDIGFTKVNGREAKHKNTYSIYVNYELFCDITYVPKYIYDNIAFKTIGETKIKYVDPHFMMIDYLKILTDPLGSGWRIEKTYTRLEQLCSVFPLYDIKESITINSVDIQEKLDECIELIYDFIKNKNDIIVIGFYAYNYFLIKSNYEKLNLIDIPYIEIISKNCKEDYTNIYNKIKEKYPDLNITYKEYYPFFMYNGYRIEIYIENELILIIYDYDNKCIPYQTLNFIDYKKNIEYSNINVNLGTFNLTLLYAQVNIIKNKIFKDRNMKLIYEKFVAHLIKMRNHYFGNTKKLLDDVYFSDLNLNCIYPDFNPEHENLIRYEKRKENNKPSMYIYDPNKNRKTEKDKNFYFPNISGNEIKNTKHSKLLNNNSDNSDDDITDDNVDNIDD